MHLLVPHWTAAGLLVSLVAGAVAAVALARIAALHLPGSRAGGRAALFLLVSPCAVFLAAGYSEALFLALALPAWLAARRQRWLSPRCSPPAPPPSASAGSSSPPRSSSSS